MVSVKSGKTVLEIETWLRDVQAMICVMMNSTLFARHEERPIKKKVQKLTIAQDQQAVIDPPR